jgi:hypothetical protein
MLERGRVARSFVWLLLLVSTFALSQSGGKKKVTSQADLPRFSYPLTGTASELVQSDDATFNAFARKVRADLDGVLRDYEIDDKATLRTLLSVKLDLEELAGEYKEGLQTVEALRALQQKPAAKLFAFLYTRARLQAAIDAKATQGTAYEQAFTKYFKEAIDPLPWDVVQDSVKESYAGSRLYTKAVAVGNVETELDPAVQKSGALDNQEAWDLISTRDDLQSEIPMRHARGEVLKQYIAAHDVVQPDIWAAREVTLTKEQSLSPVLVAIWDSGIDVSVFPDQLFTDPKPTASGTHGLAFDDRGDPSTTWLYPLTPEQQRAYPEFRELIQGRLDIENGIDTPAADALQRKYATLSAEQMHQLFELDKVLGFYVHGTHCAGARCGEMPPRGWWLRASTINCPTCRLLPRRNGPITWVLPFSRCPTTSERVTCEW